MICVALAKYPIAILTFCMHLVAPYVIVFVSSYLYVVHVLLAMSLL